MTPDQAPEAKELAAIFQRYADDPMWADHAEVHKNYLRRAATFLDSLHRASVDATEEVERLAQGLHELDRNMGGGRKSPAWGNQIPEYRDHMRSKARAIIAIISTTHPATSGGETDDC